MIPLRNYSSVACTRVNIVILHYNTPPTGNRSPHPPPPRPPAIPRSTLTHHNISNTCIKKKHHIYRVAPQVLGRKYLKIDSVRMNKKKAVSKYAEKRVHFFHYYYLFIFRGGDLPHVLSSHFFSFAPSSPSLGVTQIRGHYYKQALQPLPPPLPPTGTVRASVFFCGKHSALILPSCCRLAPNCNG